MAAINGASYLPVPKRKSAPAAAAVAPPAPAPAPKRLKGGSLPRKALSPAIDLTGDHGATFVKAFGALNEVNVGMLPRRASPKQRVAAEYWCASLASQSAEAWRTKAKGRCVAEGVLPDPATPSPIGTVETVYADRLISIGMKVVQQADRVDVPGLVVDLTKAGLDLKVLTRLLKKHTRSFAGAHIFTASLV